MWTRVRELTWHGEAPRAHQALNVVLSQDRKGQGREMVLKLGPWKGVFKGTRHHHSQIYGVVRRGNRDKHLTFLFSHLLTWRILWTSLRSGIDRFHPHSIGYYFLTRTTGRLWLRSYLGLSSHLLIIYP